MKNARANIGKKISIALILFLPNSVAILPGYAEESGAAVEKLLKPQVRETLPTKSAASSPVSPTQEVSRLAPEKIAIPPTPQDDKRTERLLNNLIKQAGWLPNVSVHVQNGMVTIQGVTKNAQQLEWLAKTADRLPSVIAVINQTVIETPAISDFSPVREEMAHLVLEAKKSLPLFGLALIVALGFFFAGRSIGGLSRKIWSRHISNPFLLSTVSKITMLPVWACFFYLVLRTAGLSGLATTIIGGTGAASIVLGFAFKGIAENYLSGLLLAIRSPFTKGDEIQVQQYAGFVQSLNMRGTTIVDYDGNVVLIPNSIVIQSVIRNRTANPNTRAIFVLTIAFHDSVIKAQSTATSILRSMPEILVKPAAGVNVDKVSSMGIDLAISFWFDASRSSGDRLKAELVERIKDAFLKTGIHLPVYPLNAPQGTAEPGTRDIPDTVKDIKILNKTVHTDLLQPN